MAIKIGKSLLKIQKLLSKTFQENFMTLVGRLSFKVISNMIYVRQYVDIDSDIAWRFGSFNIDSLTFDVDGSSVCFKIGSGGNPSRTFKNLDNYSATEFANKLFDAILEEQDKNSMQIQ